MSRVALVLVLLLSAQVASAADLPPGALARLGDDRFRAGSGVYNLAISPDGKQYATVRYLDLGFAALTLWDATTGRPVREHKLNALNPQWGTRGSVFKGIVWNEAGGFAIHSRVEPLTAGEEAKVYSDDFRVWEFTDPKAKGPPVFPLIMGLAGAPLFGGVAGTKAEYTEFHFSGDGRRVAAVWKSEDEKFAVHVFELKAADSVAKLKRVGVLDLGAEGADAVRVSGDGKTVVTFRTLKPNGPNGQPEESAATVWDVARGKPERPVRVPHASDPIIISDARELLVGHWDEKEFGYDALDLRTAKRRTVARWKQDAREFGPVLPFFPSSRAFVPSGIGGDESDRVIAVVDVATGRGRGFLSGHAGMPTAAAVSADGTRIATADDSGLVRFWDAKTLRPVHDAPGHRRAVEYAQLSPDGKRVLTWAGDETVRLWDLATGKELRAFAGAPGVRGKDGLYSDEPTFTPDGTTVLFSTKDRLMARDLQTGLEVTLPGDLKGLPPRTAVFSPDGKSLLTRDPKESSCEVWDWPSGKKRFSWKITGSFEPGFSLDGSFLFDSLTLPDRRDTKTGEKLQPVWKERRSGHILALHTLRSPPNTGLWFRQDHEALVFEGATGKPVSRYRVGSGHSANVFEPVSLSSTSGQFAGGSETTGEVYLSESASCEVRRVLNGHREFTRVLGFTPDGTKLLTAGGDHTVLVWDMRLQNVPLPDAVKKETSAAKLWDALATGNAKDAYLAMARLAREPDAALAMARMRLKPATKADRGTDAANVADARAAELLEALDTDESRLLLKELAGGHADAFRTQEAKRALERKEKK